MGEPKNSGTKGKTNMTFCCPAPGIFIENSSNKFWF
jgi:hypothetical protein